MTLDSDITILNLYWGSNVWYDATRTAPVLNDNLPSGIIDESKDNTITISSASSIKYIVVYKGYSEDVTFSNHFVMGLASTENSNRLAISSDCNTTFSDGYIFEMNNYTTIYMYNTESANTGNLYFNSQIRSPSTTLALSNSYTIGSGTNRGTVVFGGTSSNAISALHFYNNATAVFAKTGDAVAFLGTGAGGGENRTIYLAGGGFSNDSSITYASSNQMIDARIVMYLHNTTGSTAKGGIILSNGSSQEVGGITSITLSNFNNVEGNLLAYVDYTANSTAQVFALQGIGLYGEVKKGDDYLIEFAVYNFGEEDIFVYGGKIADTRKEFMKFYSDDGSTLISWDDLHESFYLNYGGVDYYAYSLIPEPAEFAMLFGFIAIVFAAYRRRK